VTEVNKHHSLAASIVLEELILVGSETTNVTD